MNRETSSDNMFRGHEPGSLMHRHRRLLTQKRIFQSGLLLQSWKKS